MLGVSTLCSFMVDDTRSFQSSSSRKESKHSEREMSRAAGIPWKFEEVSGRHVYPSQGECFEKPLTRGCSGA